MKLNDLEFQTGQGTSGRVAQGTDFISGLMFYDSTRPAAMGADNFSSGSVRQIFAVGDAVAIGINNLYSDETANVTTVDITDAGSTGDSVTINLTEWTGGTGKGLITLGKYTNLSSDSANTVATGLAAAINALNTGPNPTGYSAVASTHYVAITARKGMGVYLNAGTPFAAVVTGGATATFAQGGSSTTPGVYSKLAVMYYHIQRFFVVQPDGALFVGIFNTGGASTFSDIANMQSYSNNTIVKLGIWDDTQTFATASLTLIETEVAALRAVNIYTASVVYAADIKAIDSGVAGIYGSSAYNLAALADPHVTALIDNDGARNGYDLFQSVGKSITSLGAAIGCQSVAAISEDIGNPIDKFNCDDGLEFDTLMFGDGTTWASFVGATGAANLNALNNYRYLFLSKIPYTSGSYYSDAHVSAPYTGNLAWIYDNTILDRIIKNLWPILTPVLKGRGNLNNDGTLTVQTIQTLQALAGSVIKALIGSGDLAGDANNFDASKYIIINPTQKPNIANTLIIGVQYVEDGVFHTIVVPVGQVASV